MILVSVALFAQFDNYFQVIVFGLLIAVHVRIKAYCVWEGGYPFYCFFFFFLLFYTCALFCICYIFCTSRAYTRLKLDLFKGIGLYLQASYMLFKPAC